MTFIFKNSKFKSPTIKQSVTSPINANKSGNQEGDNDNYRFIIGDKKGWLMVFERDFKGDWVPMVFVPPFCFY